MSPPANDPFDLDFSKYAPPPPVTEAQQESLKEETEASATKLGRYDRYFRQTVASCPASTCGNLLIDNNPATIPMASMGGPGPYEQDTRGVQNVTALLYMRPLAAMRNEFVVGIDVSRQTNERLQYNYSGTRAVKALFAPQHTPEPQLAAGLNNSRYNTADDYSLFLDDRLWLQEQFSISAGVRVQRFSNRQDQTNQPAVGATTIASCDGKAGSYTTCYFKHVSWCTIITHYLFTYFYVLNFFRSAVIH